MKKQIIAGIAVIACVALCAAVWPRSAEVEGLPAEPVKSTVTDDEASQNETLLIILSADGLEVATESETPKTEVIMAEEKTEPMPPTEHVSETASIPSVTPKPSAQPSSNPKSGDKTIIDGKPHIWVPGFGWVEDEGGVSVRISVDGKGDINKQVGIMGGGTTVGNPGDELTGNKVGIMGRSDVPSVNTEPAPDTKKYIGGKPHVWVPSFGWVEDQGGGSIGTFAEEMYENSHKIGIMGGSKSYTRESSSPASGQLEPVEGEIHITFVEVPEKNSAPPPYKPDTTAP